VVVAVEAVEGTDAAIERGGSLAKSGCVVVKVSKPQQDLRFDVPAVGLETVNKLHDVRGAVLAFEAGKTILLEKEALLQQAERFGIAVVAVTEAAQKTDAH
jgi:UDP-2,3-diacylglucosamine hydrolase